MNSSHSNALIVARIKSAAQSGMATIRRNDIAVVHDNRYRQLIVAMSSIVAVVSITTQQMNMLTEDVAASSCLDAEAPDSFGDTEHQPVSDWTGPLRNCDCGIHRDAFAFGVRCQMDLAR
jgi:hypothetical protein